MSFSSWMSELRTQGHSKYATDAASVASSWADTDCDSDSDSELSNYVCFDNKKTCKSTARKLTMQRTAPISIPQATHMAHSRSSFEFFESPVRHSHVVEDEKCCQSPSAMDINEEDLMLFGNLAYFRTQHGAKSGLDFCHRSSTTQSRLTSNSSSVEDEDIFDMEL